MHTETRLSDILANSATHGVGAALAAVGAVGLLLATIHQDARHILSCAAFGATLVLVYLSSTLYHSLARTRARRLLRVFDHSAIYLLIAGTYTPFTLLALRGRTGWTLFAVIWALAFFGVLFKSLYGDRFPILSVLIYLGMGWLAVFAFKPLLAALEFRGLMWLLAGGLFYTAGIVFYAMDRRRYFHALWHLFVLAGSASHYFAILFYVLHKHL